MIFSACYDPVGEEQSASKNQDKEKHVSESCELLISLFSNSNYEQYPVCLLLFDNNGNRLKSCTLKEEDGNAVSISLNRDTYRVVALSGTSYYSIPSSFTLESLINLPTFSLPQQPLLMGQADITLASEKVRVNLQMLPQTTELSITAPSLPQQTRQVNVSLGKVYTSIDMQGQWQNAQTLSFPCQKHNSVWTAEGCYIFPTKGSSTVVTMEVIRPDSTLYYGYTLPYQLQPGFRYELSPTAGKGILVDGVLIDKGTLEGTAIEDTLVVDALPKVPGVWDGHILAYQEKSDDNVEADVWLLSINEWEDIHSAHSQVYATEASDIARTYQEGGSLSGRISRWSIPSKEEAYALRSLYAGDRIHTLNDILQEADLPVWSLTDASGENVRYLCNGGQHTFSLASASSNITKGGTKATYRLRLIKKLHLTVLR